MGRFGFSKEKLVPGGTDLPAWLLGAFICFDFTGTPHLPPAVPKPRGSIFSYKLNFGLNLRRTIKSKWG